MCHRHVEQQRQWLRLYWLGHLQAALLHYRPSFAEMRNSVCCLIIRHLMRRSLRITSPVVPIQTGPLPH
ncbi:hypothetical protein ACFX2F_014883 [Malus domestica]